MRTLDPPHTPNVEIQYTHWTERRPPQAERNMKKSTKRLKSASLRFGGSKVVVCEPQAMTSAEFCNLVQKRFKKTPQIYKSFRDIIKQITMATQPIERLDLVKRLIALFDGHPDLVLNMNQFLPDEYCIEIQDDAVVIKVFEDLGQSTLVDTGHGRSVDDPHRTVPNLGTSAPSIAYIMNVKKAYTSNPEVYTAFMGLLKHYHSKKADEIGTVSKVVALFKTRPDLVLGFNEFLPPGYSIHLYEKSGYTVEYPKGNEGMSKVKVIAGPK